MEVRKFIVAVLEEMEDLKSDGSKTNYKVKDLEFELAVVVNGQERGSLNAEGNLLGLLKLAGNSEISNNSENIQKVKIKLEPKSISSYKKNINKADSEKLLE